MSKQRDGFTFYRSYYDVYNELSKDDKVAFMDALLSKQFTGKEPDELKGMSKFAYLSQKHSIDKQVKGWEDKTGCKLLPLPRGGVRGEITPRQQEEEKGEVQEKEEEEVQVQLPQKKSKKEIPTLNEFLNYVLTVPEFAPKFESLKYSIQSKYEQWIENGWKDGHGNEIKQWKTKLKNTLPHLKPLNNFNNGTTPRKTLAEQADEITARVLGINPTQAGNDEHTDTNFEEADWCNAD